VFRVFDLRAPEEIILVRSTVAAPSWAVVRGDQGTPVVAHAPGFTVHNVISRDGMAGRAQGVPSGNGLVLPAAGRRAATPPGAADLGARVTVAELPIPANEAVPGSVYELVAFGYWWTGTGTQRLEAVLSWNAPAEVDLARGVWGLIPNGIVSGTAAIGTAALPCRWRLHGLVNFYAGSAAGGMLVQLGILNSVAGPPAGAPVDQLDLLHGETTAPAVTTSAGGIARMTLALMDNNTGGSIFATGGKSWRVG
jgi:hypothetical protein